jgi:hypothetical protein
VQPRLWARWPMRSISGDAVKCADHQTRDKKLGYIQWMFRAQESQRKGHRQRQCGECLRWFFPWEMSAYLAATPKEPR